MHDKPSVFLFTAPTKDHNLPEQSATVQPSETPEESTTLQQDTYQAPEQVNVAQPVISISERVQAKPREKKDLGTLGKGTSSGPSAVLYIKKERC